MAFIDGRGSRFRIADTDGTARDLSAYITEVRGLPGDRSLNNVTALGDSGARFKHGGEAVSFHNSATSFAYAPAGFAAGNISYTGNCWVKSYELLSRAGEPVSWQATLQVEGAVSRI